MHPQHETKEPRDFSALGDPPSVMSRLKQGANFPRLRIYMVDACSSKKSTAIGLPEEDKGNTSWKGGLGGPEIPDGSEYAEVPINSRSPIRFETDIFEGFFIFLVRPETGVQDFQYRSVFEGKRRLLEIQVQGRFKVPLEGIVYFGVELDDIMRLDPLTQGISNAILSFMSTQLSIGRMMRYSFGVEVFTDPANPNGRRSSAGEVPSSRNEADSKKIRKPSSFYAFRRASKHRMDGLMIVNPHIVFPLATFVHCVHVTKLCTEHNEGFRWGRIVEERSKEVWGVGTCDGGAREGESSNQEGVKGRCEPRKNDDAKLASSNSKTSHAGVHSHRCSCYDIPVLGQLPPESAELYKLRSHLFDGVSQKEAKISHEKKTGTDNSKRFVTLFPGLSKGEGKQPAVFRASALPKMSDMDDNSDDEHGETPLGEGVILQNNPLGFFSPENVYTFSYSSMNLDLLKWSVVNIPLLRAIPLKRLMGNMRLRFVAYVIDPEAPPVNSSISAPTAADEFARVSTPVIGMNRSRSSLATTEQSVQTLPFSTYTKRGSSKSWLTSITRNYKRSHSCNIIVKEEESTTFERATETRKVTLGMESEGATYSTTATTRKVELFRRDSIGHVELGKVDGKYKEDVDLSKITVRGGPSLEFPIKGRKNHDQHCDDMQTTRQQLIQLSTSPHYCTSKKYLFNVSVEHIFNPSTIELNE